VHSSTLKPIGKADDAEGHQHGQGRDPGIPPRAATQEEIDNTVAVMGGEDWQFWIEALDEAGVLADGAKTTAYTYIGEKLTWDIYWHGTIGAAKQDLDRRVLDIRERLAQPRGGDARVSVLKAVVTQASAAIPAMPIYLAILFKVMKERASTRAASSRSTACSATRCTAMPPLDDEGRLRADGKELDPAVQAAVGELWAQIDTDNLRRAVGLRRLPARVPAAVRLRGRWRGLRRRRRPAGADPAAGLTCSSPATLAPQPAGAAPRGAESRAMTGPGTNTYLLGTMRSPCSIPARRSTRTSRRSSRRAPGASAYIICTHTHPDHSPAWQAVAEATGATVIGALPGATITRTRPSRPDVELSTTTCCRRGAVLLRALHTPGHVSNHYCFLLEEEGLLFAGDHIMNGSTVVIIPPGRRHAGLHRLAELLLDYPLQRIAPGTAR
jgi:hypothetical protein